MLYNVKQAGGLKAIAIPIHEWLDLALFSLFKNQ